MSGKAYFIYLLIIAGTTYLIRAIPFALVKKEINNKYIKAFLQYIPYTVLAAMTFPAILYSTTYIVAAAIGLFVAIGFAWRRKSLVTVALAACISVYLVEMLIRYVG